MGVASDCSHDEKGGEGDAKSKGGGNDGPSDAISGENVPKALRRSSRPARYRAAAAAAGTASNSDSPVVTPKSTPKAKRATSSDKKKGKASKTPTPQGGNGTWTDEEREQFREGVVLHGWGNWIHIQVSLLRTMHRARHGLPYVTHSVDHGIVDIPAVRAHPHAKSDQKPRPKVLEAPRGGEETAGEGTQVIVG